MSKRVYVSADWKESNDSHSCDKTVVDRIRKWKNDNRYGVDIICTDDVHNSVTNNPDCRRCDIKDECGRNIKLSDVVIFVVGDNTESKKAGLCDGRLCSPAYSNLNKKYCKYFLKDCASNSMSYLQYEITSAVKSGKCIVIVYNSVYKQEKWIPGWYNTLLKNYNVDELCRIAFWKDSNHTQDCYHDIKTFLI